MTDIPLPRLFALLPLFGLSLAGGPPLAAASPDKHPITHEDIWLMKRVGTPAVSPDGHWVVFPVTQPAYDEKDQSSDLWLAPADGNAPPRQVTFTKGPENGASWSPDSRKLAFSAKRDGDETAQIYILDLSKGGEARRLTDLSTGARYPQWRPDGRAILFVSNVYPGALDDEANKKAAAERKARKFHVRVYDSFPVRYWDKWLDELQPHLFVQALDGGRARDLLAGSALVKEPGYAGVESETSEDLDAAWAPDGASVVFAATTERNASAYSQVSAHLYQVGAGGAREEPKRLTPDAGSYGRPAFTPDGLRLLAVDTELKGKVYADARLVAYSWPALSERTILAANLDDSVGKFVAAPDSRAVYFLAEDKGCVRIFAAPVSGADGHELGAQTAGAYAGLAIGGTAGAPPVLAAAYDTAVNPTEMVRIDLSGKAHPLSVFNVAAAAAIDWQPLRTFWFTAKNGKRIHNFIALPPGFDPARKYPLISIIHGGAANMFADSLGLRWNYHLLARPGYVILLTNYTGSTGFGEKFAQDIQGDPLRGPGEELNEAVDAAINQFSFVDATRLAAGGASYGAHLANWLEATTTRYKCLVSHSGEVDLQAQWGSSDGNYHRELASGGAPWGDSPVWRDQSPIHYAANFRTPMLLSVGEHDFRVPINNTLENWSALQRMKVPSKLLVWPDENHHITNGEDSRYFYREVLAWFGTWIK